MCFGFGLYYVPEDVFRKLGVGLKHDPYDPEKCHSLEETHHSPTTLLQLWHMDPATLLPGDTRSFTWQLGDPQNNWFRY